MFSVIPGMIRHIIENTGTLYLEAAPWIMLGLLAAGLIHAWVPQQKMARWLGGRGPWPLTKAALMGAPLPLCSCGVIPAALGLHRAGASRGSTLAFLIATPETGVDSVGASYALLGPVLTIARPVTAILSGIITGLVADLMPAAAIASRSTARASVCCATNSDRVGGGPETHDDAPDCGDGCRSANTTVASRSERQGVGSRTASGLRYAVTELLDDFSLWLLIGLAVAGVTITLVPPTALASYGSGLPAMLLMLIIGIPFYVCATESTPIATAMLLAGVSPGTVLVFLLAGPATNLATVGALRQEFGWRLVMTYVAGISLCALGFGLLTDYMVATLGINITAQLHVSQALLPAWIKYASGLALAVLAVRPFRVRVIGA